MKPWFILALLLANVGASTEHATPSTIKPRVFVLAEISNEPDDEESLARLLV